MEVKTKILSIPTFETDRLILRGVNEQDIPSYEKHFVDYEVISELDRNVPWPYPEGGVGKFLHTKIFPHQGINKWTWGVFLKENPKELIGAIGLLRDGVPEHRGFWLGRKFWGNGYMTEAVEPTLDYAFNNLNFTNMIFENALGNTKSRRIKEKTGARLIRIESARFVNPEYTKRELWELTKADWETFRGRPTA